MGELLDLLRTALAKAGTETSRLFHGRGQHYPGLEFITADWFSPVLLITFYREPNAQAWSECLAGLQEAPGAAKIILLQRRYLARPVMECVYGQSVLEGVAVEGSLSFALSFGDKQNIGYFMDASPARQWLQERVEGKRVLNLFSYTCAFSVAAIDAGASSVINVDMSKAALQVGRANHRLNEQQDALAGAVHFMPHNIFRSWRNIIKRGPFDVVIIDPPSRQKGSFVVEKDYSRIIKRLPELLPGGGDILACLNAPYLGEQFMLDHFLQHCPAAKFQYRLDNREDFPEKDNQRNLKMMIFAMNE